MLSILQSRNSEYLLEIWPERDAQVSNCQKWLVGHTIQHMTLCFPLKGWWVFSGHAFCFCANLESSEETPPYEAIFKGTASGLAKCMHLFYLESQANSFYSMLLILPKSTMSSQHIKTPSGGLDSLIWWSL
jgi:hypothetical protein